MSTQAIKDYLVKQIFIEKNVVTYRSLSRQFGIHVNVAKEELATYHEKAPYDGQKSFATYLLTGEILKPQRRARTSKGKGVPAEMSMDVDDEEDAGMDIFIPTQTESADGDEELDDYEEEDEDYEDVTTIGVKIVNESELEDAKSEYHRLSSVHVYSLSPSIIHDASHLCSPTAAVRQTDNTKGEEHAKVVGRVVASNIHVKPMKPKDLPAAKVNVEDSAPKTTTSKPAAGATTKSLVAPVKSEGDKKAAQVPGPKKTGKLDFFGGAGKKKEQEKAPVVKKEDPAPKAEEKKSGKVFFGASTSKAKAKETTKPGAVKQEEEEVTSVNQAAKQRGTKRKSALDFSDSETEAPVKAKKANAAASTSKATTPASSRAPSVTGSKPPSTTASSRRSSAAFDFDEEQEEEEEQKPKAKPKVKRGVVISDDEDEEDPKPIKKGISKKDERMRKAREIEEREARALMEMDDDHVERVSRRASNRPNPLINASDDEDDESAAVKTKHTMEDDDGEDTSMDVDSEVIPLKDEQDDEDDIPKPKLQKRKREKAPIGRNGLKKRKVTKTRKFKGPDGYMQTEDFSDWESVDEEQEEEKPKAKPRAVSRKTTKVKVKEEEEEESGGSNAPSQAPSVSKKETKAAAPKAPKEAKPKTAVASKKGVPAKGKGQAGIQSFFNVAQK